MKRLLATTLILLATSLAFAQSGKITGVITDAETGETLIGANVIIEGTLMGSATDFDGRYVILNVPPGTYSLVVRYIGFASITVEEVVVRSSLTTEQNFELRPESFAGEEVIVTAEKPVVLKDVTSSEARVSSEEIAKLPVQELTDVVKLQAGVNVANDGGIHIRGGRATEVAYIVDGIRVTDDYNRSQGLRIENQSVEELQIISGTFNAEYGQAMSGIVNIVTKAGGNEFKGRAGVLGGSYYIYDANLWRDVPNQISELEPFNERQVTASLEGPIIKDKLTFFTSFRYYRDNGYVRARNAYSTIGGFDFNSITGETAERNTAGWSQTLPLNGFDINNYRDPWGRSFNPSDPWASLDTTVVGGQQAIVLTDSGIRDSSIVNMNTRETYNVSGNLQYNVSKKLKFNLIGSYGQEEFMGYNHQFRLVPFSQSPFYRTNYMVNFKTTVTPSSKTYMTFNIANTNQNEQSYLYDDPLDPRYVSQGLPPGPANNRFSQFGTNLGRFFRSTNSYRSRLEISSQVNSQNFVKAGLELQMDFLEFDSYSLQRDDQGDPTQLFIPDETVASRQRFDRNPIVAAAYIQDKIEFEKFIINVGLRFDYFNANDEIPADPRDPDIFRPTNPLNEFNDLNGDGTISMDERDPSNAISVEEREAFWWKDVDAKMQVSPRLGIAYSISDNGVVHFSYGHFFQTPTYSQLYNNSRILINRTGGFATGFGNPDLDAERTIQYELGLKQEIFEGTAIELTGFYRDSRDYVANAGIQGTYNTSITYQKNINLAFAKTRGATVALSQVISRTFNFAIDYTYTRVEGSTTNFGALAANAIGPGNITGQEQQDVWNFLILQGWDKPHILNTQLFYNQSTWGMNLTGQYQSGQPYTPFIPIAVPTGLGASQQDLTNRSRLPATFVVNLNAYKNFNIGGFDAGFSVNVFNLLDSKLITNVYGDSGEPDRPFFLPGGVVDPTFLNSPNNYGQPRRIQFSFNLSF